MKGFILCLPFYQLAKSFHVYMCTGVKARFKGKNIESGSANNKKLCKKSLNCFGCVLDSLFFYLFWNTYSQVTRYCLWYVCVRVSLCARAQFVQCISSKIYSFVTKLGSCATTLNRHLECTKTGTKIYSHTDVSENVSVSRMTSQLRYRKHLMKIVHSASFFCFFYCVDV